MRRREISSTDAEVAEAGGQATSLVRGLSILRAFRAGDPTLGNQELIDRTGFPKATVSRLCSTLVQEGYLSYDESSGRYSIGAATVSLGYGALSSNAVAHVAQPLLEQVAERTGTSVAVGTRDGDAMVYLANCRSSSPAALQLGPGSRLPIWRTAMGLSYLVGQQADQRERLVRALVSREPESAVRIKSAIRSAIACQEEHGFVVSLGTWYSYINGVGVVFQPEDGSPLLSITCGAIVDIMPSQLCFERAGPELISLVERLRARLRGDTRSRERGRTGRTRPG